MISNIMSKKVVTVKPDALLRNVVATMDKYDYKEIPIVDDNERLIGQVSYIDILDRVKFTGDSKIENFMSRSPVIKEDDSEVSALKIMINSGSTGLPVINEQKKVVGFVSDYDILNFFKNDKSIANMKVSELPIKNIEPVIETANIGEVRKLMHFNKIDRLPVIDKKGKFSGTILSIDILRTFYANSAQRIGKKEFVPRELTKTMDVSIQGLIRPDAKVNTNDTLKDTIDEMLKNHIVGIVIVNNNNEPMGVIDRQAILKKIEEISKVGLFKISVSGEKLNPILQQEIISVIKNNLRILPKYQKSIQEVKVHVKAVHKDQGDGKVEMTLNVNKDGGPINIKRVGFDTILTLIDCLDTVGQLLK
ncbi:Inosine-5'-monophosphate dehydrogenase [Candidatus Tiddalikarchaeum anstoanum]|nr:Inosine-5'-monophosphate dehydrogenase [Candidatus Tiddalikarchaeum anstoanum]